MATLISGNSRSLVGLSVAIAESPLERWQALELHRSVYVRKGLLPADAAEPRLLPQTSAAGSAMFIAREHDALVGTMTFFMDSSSGLPIDDVHREEVDAVRRRCVRVAEVGGLAVAQNRRGYGITMMLYDATFRWAMAIGTEYLIACVNPAFRRVYSRLLLFEVLGACKLHPRFLSAPSIPIGLDLAADRLGPKRRALAGEQRAYVERHYPAATGAGGTP